MSNTRYNQSTYLLLLLITLMFSELGFIPVAHAQVDQIQFHNFSLADGLSSDSITDIVEDNSGFIWVATTEGLNRFDGYKFKQYLHELDNSGTIPEQFVRQLYLDSHGDLWIASSRGLARYVRHTDSFERFTSATQEFESDRFSYISELTDGTVIAASEKHFYQFNRTTKQFSRLNYSGEPLPSFVSYIIDLGEQLLIGSFGQGIYTLSKENKRLISLRFPSLALPPSKLNTVLEHNNKLWLGTDVGTIVLNQDLTLAKEETEKLTQLQGDREIISLIRHGSNSIWAGTSQGLDVINSDTLQINVINRENAIQAGLTASIITKLFKDSNESVWVGSYSAGLSRYHSQLSAIQWLKPISNSEYGLSGNIIWALEQDAQDQIWIATQQQGIDKLTPDTGKIDHYLQDFPFPIWDIAMDSHNKLWIASANGLYVYSPNNQTLSQTQHLFSGQNVESLLIDGSSTYMADESGKLLKINTTSFEVESIELDPSIHFLRPSLVDKDNNVWLISNLGLLKYYPNTKQYDNVYLNLGYNSVSFSGIYEDEDSFWASTYEHGIVKFNKQDFSIIEHLTQQDGLHSNTVISMFIEPSYIGIVSLKSVEFIDKITNTVVKNLSEREFDYASLNEGAGLYAKNNKLYIGSTKGVFALNVPALLENNTQILPAPTLTGLSIFNQPVQPGIEGSPLEQPIELTKVVKLSHSDSPLSIEFAQLNPPNPNAINYRYKLIGSDSNWLTPPADSRQATYTNIGFGQFDFQVQSRHFEGPWSDSRHLTIWIAPPFWLSNQAIAAYITTVLLMVIVIFRYIQNRRQVVQRIKTSEERLKLTLWSSGDELWDWNAESDTLLRSNTWNLIDFPTDRIRQKSSADNVHPSDRPSLTRHLVQHIEGKTDYFEVSYRVKTFDGCWLWVLDRGQVVQRNEQGAPVRMTGTLKNIQHLKVAEEQLKLFKTSFENISDSVFITDRNFKFVSVNNAYCECTKQSQEQALASYLRFYQYPEAFTEEVKKTLFYRGSWSGELESRRLNGEKFQMELNIDALHDEDGEISHFVGVFSDVTARKATEKELIKLTNIDPLTSLPNRSFFQGSHDTLVKRQTPHTLLCLDMDNFKKVNDSIGHEAGDQLIQQIASRLQKILGTSATCYRLGGDEFSILLEGNQEAHQVTILSQQILDYMHQAFSVENQEFVLGCSIGIAFYPNDGKSSQELLKNADTAMYYAKNNGGNHYQFFSDSMNKDAVRQVQIENLIRRGLKEDQFTVFYQPKIEIATGKLVGMEALVRFQHPEKGLVPPNQFIDLAERTGQICEIGEMVLLKACEDTQRWVEKGLFTGRVAVNISAKQFEVLNLDQIVARTLRNTRLKSEHLECEITESTLMQQPEHALKLMILLREQGVHLALDDFGTGYSSLAYLKQFPINTLKIDKAFIDDIVTSLTDQQMLLSIINIAHNLGLDVVAEGVESEDQLNVLHKFKCEMLQGFLYSKPLSAERFEKLLIENKNVSDLATPNSIRV